MSSHVQWTNEEKAIKWTIFFLKTLQSEQMFIYIFLLSRIIPNIHYFDKFDITQLYYFYYFIKIKTYKLNSVVVVLVTYLTDTSLIVCFTLLINHMLSSNVNDLTH